MTGDLVVLTLNCSLGVFNRHAVRKRLVKHLPFETKELFEEVRKTLRAESFQFDLLFSWRGCACFSFCEDA